MVAHQLSAVQKATKVLAMPPLGDRRPSQMLADLLEFCPTGEENTFFFRAAFMQRLPAELQVLLDGTEDGDLKQLAQKADKLWSIRRPADTAVSAVTQQEEEDSEWVAAVQHNKKKEWGEKKHNTGSSSGSGGRTSGSHGGNGGRRPPKMFTVCYRHMKFGAAAYKCDDPASCTYKGNYSSWPDSGRGHRRSWPPWPSFDPCGEGVKPIFSSGHRSSILCDSTPVNSTSHRPSSYQRQWQAHTLLGIHPAVTEHRRPAVYLEFPTSRCCFPHPGSGFPSRVQLTSGSPWQTAH